MDNIEKEMNAFQSELSNFHIPRYEELPDIELYMDQVLALLNKQLYIISNNDSVITASMVNNYVKFGLIPAPSGKRYTGKHICYIITLCFLKQILSMNEIKLLMNQFIHNSCELKAYILFCNELEAAFKNISSLDSDNELAVTPCLAHCAKAIAHKLKAQKFIQLINASTTAVREAVDEEKKKEEIKKIENKKIENKKVDNKKVANKKNDKKPNDKKKNVKKK